VGTPELEASHHPDAFHLRGYAPRAFLAAAQAEPPPSLSWLKFRPPVPAEVTLVEARPRFLCSACSTSPIREAQGPWFLEGNWWETRRWSREEWDIATDEGAYRLVRSGGGWFLDGIYA
jgi:protein ImuB